MKTKHSKDTESKLGWNLVRAKLLILAGLTSCLWGPRELPVPSTRFLFETPVLTNIEEIMVYCDSVQSQFKQVCPVYLDNDLEREKLGSFFATLCLHLYFLHFSHLNLPAAQRTHTFSTRCSAPVCWNGIRVDQICENPIIASCFSFIKRGFDPDYQRRFVYMNQSRFVKYFTGFDTLCEPSEAHIGAFALYFAQCFGGTLGLIGGTLNRIIVDENVFTIDCKLGDNKSSVQVTIDMIGGQMYWTSRIIHDIIHEID